MTVQQIKDIISNNNAVLLWFGADYDFAREVALRTHGYISANHPSDHNEYVMLYLNGGFSGFNRDGSVEFFKIDFPNKVAHYEKLDWLVVDLSRRKGCVI